MTFTIEMLTKDVSAVISHGLFLSSPTRSALAAFSGSAHHLALLDRDRLSRLARTLRLLNPWSKAVATSVK